MFLLILKARRRALGRNLHDDWATYFLLGPVMIGMVLLLGRRIFNDFAVDIGRIKPVDFSDETILRFTFALLFLKVFFNFLPLARRFYPTERWLSVDDLLPIRFEIRYQVFYLEQLVRDLPFFIVAVFLLMFFGKGNLVGWAVMIWLFFPGIEIGFTLTWIHLRSPNRAELLLVLVLLSSLLWFLPIKTLGLWADLVSPIMVLMGYWGFGKWRYRDAGHVEQFFTRRQEGSNRLEVFRAFSHRLSHVIPRGVRPLVWRDIILTSRNFVPPFWRNLALALMIGLATAVRGGVSPAPLCAAGALLMASTASPLFSLQRPFRSLDYVMPIPIERIWRAKVIYAVLISLPIPWFIWAVEMFVRPVSFLESLTLLFTLLLVGIAVGSLTGGTICEGDQRPALHLIIAAFLSALATLFIAMFHPVLFLLIFPVLSYLRDAAVTRLENEVV